MSTEISVGNWRPLSAQQGVDSLVTALGPTQQLPLGVAIFAGRTNTAAAYRSTTGVGPLDDVLRTSAQRIELASQTRDVATEALTGRRSDLRPNTIVLAFGVSAVLDDSSPLKQPRIMRFIANMGVSPAYNPKRLWITGGLVAGEAATRAMKQGQSSHLRRVAELVCERPLDPTEDAGTSLYMTLHRLMAEMGIDKRHSEAVLESALSPGHNHPPLSSDSGVSL